MKFIADFGYAWLCFEANQWLNKRLTIAKSMFFYTNLKNW